MNAIKKLFSIIVFIILFADNSNAQKAEGFPEKFSGLKLGYSYNELQESSLNRIKHAGNGFLAGWFFEKLNEKTVKGFEFQLITNMLKSSYETEPASLNFNLPLNYHYLFNLYNPNLSTNFYVGGYAGMNFNIEYFDNWDENHFYWMTNYSLGSDFRFDYSLTQRRKLQIEAKFPLISLVSRPPAQTMKIQSKSGFFDIVNEIHENPHFAFIDKHFEFKILIRYNLFDSGKIQSNVFWQMHYLRNKVAGSEQVKMVNHSFGIELCF